MHPEVIIRTLCHRRNYSTMFRKLDPILHLTSSSVILHGRNFRPLGETPIQKKIKPKC